MFQVNKVMGQERLDRYIDEVARVVGYSGFGARGADLNQSHWWAVYIRQSLREQAENDRVADYLLACARLAEQAAVTVPKEYIIYDADSSEHLGRPGMKHLRRNLVAGRRIAGVIIPSVGRLTMDVHHLLTFEKECAYYGVQLMYGDAPGGTDLASRAARLLICTGNEVRVTSNRSNPLGGNKSRCLMGKVPAHRTPYGYKYQRDAVVDQRGRVKVLHAWWEIAETGPEGNLIEGSPAWVVAGIFNWIGNEGRSAYWVVNKLKEMGIRCPDGGSWDPERVSKIVRRRSYTGKAIYNLKGRYPNPSKPLGDLTLGIARTITRPKPDDGRPENEKVPFNVPALVSEDLWQRANDALTERGRGRGKQGKAIQALFRNRMICPKCNRPMSVMRDKRGQVYYYCPWRYRRWVKQPCTYSHLVPSRWDNEIYGEICVMLRDDAWLETQLIDEMHNDDSVDKLIRMEQWKIRQAEAKIARIQEAYEGSEHGKPGTYTKEEATSRIARHRETIAVAEREIARLREQAQRTRWNPRDAETLRGELKALRDRNLDAATFEEREELVAKLGINVYPSEDLRCRRVRCRLNLRQVDDVGEHAGNCGKILFGGAGGIRTRYLLTASQALSQLSYSPKCDF